MNSYQDAWGAVVARAQQKDSPALRELLDEFDNLIQSAARRFFVPQNERGDLLQEAYLGFLRAVSTYDPARGGAFAGYAKAKTQEAVWQYIRKRNRLSTRELPDKPVNGGDEEAGSMLEQMADPQAQSSFTEIEWRHLLTSLSEREALAVERLVIDGLSMAELARMENVSPGTVKTWKQRAFEKIRAELQKTRID